ncbi:Hypothetical_protein [Hexamita inflata]|uniref:Hypothetical_protein n=1 Tax=Hexamita inflata TaxID=28002 RepID=A0AA86UDR3_9EUKA|nr:Hypothetical protein HINF_LOCUS39299 [Hexamita inflata]
MRVQDTNCVQLPGTQIYYKKISQSNTSQQNLKSTVAKSTICTQPIESQFKKFSLQAKCNDQTAFKLFTQIQATKQMLQSKWKQQEQEVAHEDIKREKKWRKKLENSPYCSDQLMYFQHNEELQKMKERNKKRQQWEEKRKQEIEKALMETRAQKAYFQDEPEVWTVQE